MAADEAKQLDSVTDRIADTESMDANKATAAMSSLNAKKVDGLKDLRLSSFASIIKNLKGMVK